MEESKGYFSVQTVKNYLNACEILNQKEFGYFIFMVAFGRFLQMLTRQMAYIIYLIEVSGNKYQKATVLKRILQWQ